MKTIINFKRKLLHKIILVALMKFMVKIMKEILTHCDGDNTKKKNNNLNIYVVSKHYKM